MIKNYFELLRIPQWIKNLFVFVPLLFSLHLFDKEYFLTTLFAFFLFSLASSFIYVVNDIIDVDSDAAHPKKKLRPLPSGRIKKQSALVIAGIVLILLILLSSFVNYEFRLFLLGFLLLNVLYSFFFKHIVIKSQL